MDEVLKLTLMEFEKLVVQSWLSSSDVFELRFLGGVRSQRVSIKSGNCKSLQHIFLKEFIVYLPVLAKH